MAITWYLIVSAVVFSIGAGGVLVRRNPLVILLCIELMLNAGNLALVAFARANGDMEGQIFAIIVMVVAACEVAVGLGLIVALYRRKLPIDVDRLRELQG
jgi:NADH-quinone oxidoreductase subunit K